jgi:hypothetical protein
MIKVAIPLLAMLGCGLQDKPKVKECTVYDNGTTVTIECPDGSTAEVNDGQQGETGSTGATGQAGNNGSTGVAGDQGRDGRDGRDGSNGEDGERVGKLFVFATPSDGECYELLTGIWAKAVGNHYDIHNNADCSHAENGTYCNKLAANALDKGYEESGGGGVCWVGGRIMITASPDQLFLVEFQIGGGDE